MELSHWTAAKFGCVPTDGGAEEVYGFRETNRTTQKAATDWAQLVKEESAKTFFSCSITALVFVTSSSPPVFFPGSLPEVRSCLTFLSVAQRLSLSSDVQTQVSGLQRQTRMSRGQLVTQLFIYILKLTSKSVVYKNTD